MRFKSVVCRDACLREIRVALSGRHEQPLVEPQFRHL